jgi:hypothetical protein
VGAVEVGEHHEAFHAGTELEEAEPFGVVEQHRGEFEQPFAYSWVGRADRG